MVPVEIMYVVNMSFVSPVMLHVDGCQCGSLLDHIRHGAGRARVRELGIRGDKIDVEDVLAVVGPAEGDLEHTVEVVEG